MRVDVRVYKRWDLDLVAFCDAGYPIADMMRDAVCAYANGQPLYYLIDEYIPFDLNNKQSFHLAFDVSPKDTNTIYMLKNIKHGYRNSFCKMILRNTFIQQNVTGYFADTELIKIHNYNLNFLNLNLFQNIKKCSEIKNNKRDKVNKSYKQTKQDGMLNNGNFYMPQTMAFQMPQTMNIPINNSFAYSPYPNVQPVPTQGGVVNRPEIIINPQLDEQVKPVIKQSEPVTEQPILTTVVEKETENIEKNNVLNDTTTEDTSITGASNNSLMNAFLALTER